MSLGKLIRPASWDMAVFEMAIWEINEFSEMASVDRWGRINSIV